MAQKTAAGKAIWPWRWISQIPQPVSWLIIVFIVAAVGLGFYRFERSERGSIAQDFLALFAPDFFALCLDGIVFAGLVAYLEGRQALTGRVRLKSHMISLLLAALPKNDRERFDEALSAGRGSSGVYALSPDALDPVLNGLAPQSGPDIQVLSGMLPVAAELSGQHLKEWGSIVESVKAYRAASPDSQEAIFNNLRGALDAFLREEVFAP